jgi:tetratricopeptide (TPR) repeat protein
VGGRRPGHLLAQRRRPRGPRGAGGEAPSPFHRPLSRNAAGLGEFGEAITALRGALEELPREAALHAQLGWYLFQDARLSKQERQREALESLDRALAINPSEAQAHYFRAVVYDQSGRHEDAQAGLKAALRARPDYKTAKDLLEKLERDHTTVAKHVKELGKKTDLKGPLRYVALAVGLAGSLVGGHSLATRWLLPAPPPPPPPVLEALPVAHAQAGPEGVMVVVTDAWRRLAPGQKDAALAHTAALARQHKVFVSVRSQVADIALIGKDGTVSRAVGEAEEDP